MIHAKSDGYKPLNNDTTDLRDFVPNNWYKRKLSHTFKKIGSGTTPKSGSDIYYENGTINWINTGDLNDNILHNCRHKITKAALQDFSLTIYPVGSIIIAMYGATIGKTSISMIEGCTNQACCVLNDSRIMDVKFLLYWFISKREFIISLSYGGGQPNISQDTIKNLRVITPPLFEQTSITIYLDTKTTQIDRKIYLLTQKAIQYGKLKQSLINETVTRGLDKTVTMKDSGVEWIGEVPEHWAVKRCANIAVQNKVKNNGLRETNLLSLSYGRIIRKDFNSSFGLLPESFETYQVIKSGTVILRLTDLQNDKKSLRVGLAREQGIITSAYLGLCFHRSINPLFAYYLLHVYDLCKVFYWFGGGLRSTMRFDDIKVIPFLLPPIEEQVTIANYLDKKTAHIDRIISTINTQIEKLKELRKTLINDVVTGKIKVVTE